MIGKGRAIELIDKKIAQLESIREPGSPDNLYDEMYSQIYYGTEELLAQLFSKEKVEEFRSNLPIPAAWSGGRNYAAEIRSYKNHIGTCIALLKSYREHIEDFWPTGNGGNDTTVNVRPQSVWERLLQQCQRLEVMAGLIQPSFLGNTPVNSNLPADKIEQLTGDYYSWYGECLSVLQDDLKEKFRIAYDGGNVSPYVCIQRFLEAPLDTFLRRKTDAGWRSERAYETKWKYPYERRFRNPIRTQRQILVVASKRKSMTYALSEPDANSSFLKELEVSKMENVSAMDSSTVTDVVIITALAKERDAVLRHLGSYHEKKTKGRTIYKASVRVQESDNYYQIILLSLSAMGNLHAAAATQQAISVWNPSHIILTGIAGGVKKGTSRYLGDLLVGEQIVSYEPGKKTESGIQRRYEVYRPARILLEAAKNLPVQGWALSTIVPRPDGTTGRVIPNVHFGVVASGEKVVADAALTSELQSDWSQIVGIEMEGAGTALAAAYYADDLPGILLVKGICDWADNSKNDDWQEYAADAAASFVIKLLESGPFESKVKPQPTRKDRKPSSAPGRVKIDICMRMVQNWPDLADYFAIPAHERARFDKGREPQGVWEWLEQRGKLLELEEGLEAIGRDDLVSILKQHQSS